MRYLIIVLTLSLLLAGSVLASYETYRCDSFTADHLVDVPGTAMALVLGGIPAGTEPTTLKKFLEGRGVNDKVLEGLFAQADKVGAPAPDGLASWSSVAPKFISALECGNVEVREVSPGETMWWVGYVPNHPISAVSVLTPPHYWALDYPLKVYVVRGVIVATAEGQAELFIGFMKPCGNLVFLGGEILGPEPNQGPGQKGTPPREPVKIGKPIRKPIIGHENWVSPSFGSP
jgi:hypothetical protein